MKDFTARVPDTTIRYTREFNRDELIMAFQAYLSLGGITVPKGAVQIWGLEYPGSAAPLAVLLYQRERFRYGDWNIPVAQQKKLLPLLLIVRRVITGRSLSEETTYPILRHRDRRSKCSQE